VSLLWLIRLLTLLVALSYGVYYAPLAQLAMYLNPGLSIIGETGQSALVTAGTVGIYITAPASVVLAFFALPRWRVGARALSSCFFVMGLCLLTRFVDSFSMRLLPWDIQVSAYLHTVMLALPPFILAAVLGQPIIEEELQRTR
jgi:hypothetical protein